MTRKLSPCYPQTWTPVWSFIHPHPPLGKWGYVIHKQLLHIYFLRQCDLLLVQFTDAAPITHLVANFPGVNPHREVGGEVGVKDVVFKATYLQCLSN